MLVGRLTSVLDSPADGQAGNMGKLGKELPSFFTASLQEKHAPPEGSVVHAAVETNVFRSCGVPPGPPCPSPVKPACGNSQGQ